jgi:hypothetical protein
MKRRLLRKTDCRFVTREENAYSCTQAWLSARPRSASPSKRPRINTEAQDSGSVGFEDVRGFKRRRTYLKCGTLDSQSTDSHDYLCSGSEVSESRDALLLENLKT